MVFTLVLHTVLLSSHFCHPLKYVPPISLPHISLLPVSEILFFGDHERTQTLLLRLRNEIKDRGNHNQDLNSVLLSISVQRYGRG